MKVSLLLFISIFLIVSGCGKKPEIKLKPSELPPIFDETKKTLELIKDINKKKYYYRGDKYRDPMAPLLNEDGSPMIPFTPHRRRNVEELLTRLYVTGIVWEKDDGKFKGLASLSDGDRETYIVKDGNLFAPDGSLIPGIVVIVKKTEVVLITKQKVIRKYLTRGLR